MPPLRARVNANLFIYAQFDRGLVVVFQTVDYYPVPRLDDLTSRANSSLVCEEHLCLIPCIYLWTAAPECVRIAKYLAADVSISDFQFWYTIFPFESRPFTGSDMISLWLGYRHAFLPIKIFMNNFVANIFLNIVMRRCSCVTVQVSVVGDCEFEKPMLWKFVRHGLFA